MRFGRDTTPVQPAASSSWGQRVYDPAIGRFLQTDPVAGGSATDYDYANQDPINGTDLAGTKPQLTEYGWKVFTSSPFFSMDLNVRLNGRQVQVRFIVKPAAGVRVTNLRVRCRQEKRGWFDHSCGTRGAGYHTFYLREDHDYHLDFRFGVWEGRNQIASGVGRTGTFTCRHHWNSPGGPCRFKL